MWSIGLVILQIATLVVSTVACLATAAHGVCIDSIALALLLAELGPCNTAFVQHFAVCTACSDLSLHEYMLDVLPASCADTCVTMVGLHFTLCGSFLQYTQHVFIWHSTAYMRLGYIVGWAVASLCAFDIRVDFR